MPSISSSSIRNVLALLGVINRCTYIAYYFTVVKTRQNERPTRRRFARIAPTRRPGIISKIPARLAPDTQRLGLEEIVTKWAEGVNSTSTLLVTALAGCFAIATWTARGQAVDFESRRLQSDAISESSGLVASRTHDGVFWTHNDSGDAPRIFAIDRSGALLA